MPTAAFAIVVGFSSICCVDRSGAGVDLSRQRTAAASIRPTASVGATPTFPPKPKRRMPPGTPPVLNLPGEPEAGSASWADRDPRELLRTAIERYKSEIQTYSCMFWRQERVGGKLTKQQGIEVLHRESPRAVLMKWVINPVQVRRCLYVEGRNRNRNGQECALVEPANSFVRLCKSRVSIPIHGPRARKSSLHSIDEFGFYATLTRITHINEIADQFGELDLKIVGEGEIDGRPTIVIERRLPRGRPGRNYPDAKFVVQLDREWLMPVSMQSYADEAGNVLLGSYIITNVRLNAEFDDVLLEF